MGRLTIEKDVKEMSMYELTHNSCYVKDGLARYRDFETDIDCRDLARKLMVDYGLWRGIPEYGLDADNELVDDDIFDESILESLQYGTDTIEGLIALFYRNLWAMADLRTILKKYEDLEEQGGLVEQKHGAWEESKNFDDCFWVCSNCKFPSEATAAPIIYNYCPNCGAKMELEVQNG